MKTSLPTLESVRIAEPCPMRWDELAGDDRKRFCSACGKHVYNLSALPRAEAERLAAGRSSVECISLSRFVDGTVKTADSTRRSARSRRPVAIAAAFWTAVLLTLGCGKSSVGTRTPTTKVNSDGSTEFTDENGVTMVRMLGKMK